MSYDVPALTSRSPQRLRRRRNGRTALSEKRARGEPCTVSVYRTSPRSRRIRCIGSGGYQIKLINEDEYIYKSRELKTRYNSTNATKYSQQRPDTAHVQTHDGTHTHTTRARSYTCIRASGNKQPCANQLSLKQRCPNHLQVWACAQGLKRAADRGSGGGGWTARHIKLTSSA